MDIFTHIMFGVFILVIGYAAYKFIKSLCYKPNLVPLFPKNNWHFSADNNDKKLFVYKSLTGNIAVSKTPLKTDAGFYLGCELIKTIDLESL